MQNRTVKETMHAKGIRIQFRNWKVNKYIRKVFLELPIIFKQPKLS